MNGYGEQPIVPDMFPDDVTIDPLDSHLEAGPVAARGGGSTGGEITGGLGDC